MKIAVCISGQLRKLEENLIATAFKDYDVDYYIHTWAHHLNPNLKNIYKHFPNAKIEIESYDKFDNLFVDSEFDTDVNVNRYRYAQFYTISKSFNLCKNSNKQYDCYIRTRTDVVWPVKFRKESMEQFNDELYYIMVNNTRHVPNKSDVIFSTSTTPTIATSIAGYYNEFFLLREWAWCMNKSAFDILTGISTDDLVTLAKLIRNNIESKDSENKRIVSPGIWGEIFKRNNMCIMDSTLCSTMLLRYYGDKRKHIQHYGDIS